MTICESSHRLPLGCPLAISFAIAFLSTSECLNALTRVAHEAVPLSSHFFINALFWPAAFELSSSILSISAGFSPSTKARLVQSVMSSVLFKTARSVFPIMIMKNGHIIDDK